MTRPIIQILRKGLALTFSVRPQGLFPLFCVPGVRSFRRELRRDVLAPRPLEIHFVLAALIQSVRYLVFIFLRLPMEVAYSTRRFGAGAKSDSNISVLRQVINQILLGISFCIEPYDFYILGIFRSPKNGLDCVFGFETLNLHNSQNRRVPCETLSLFDDKLEFERFFSSTGLVVNTTLDVLTEMPESNEELFKNGDEIFLKTRFGHGGKGYFQIVRHGDSFEGLDRHGHRVRDGRIIRNALKGLLSNGDVLIQALTSEPSALAALSRPGCSTHFRVITWHDGGRISILASFFVVPVSIISNGSAINLDAIVAVDASTYDIVEPYCSRLAMTGQRQLEIRVIVSLKDLIEPEVISNMIGNSIEAHAAISGPWAIAWDWLLGENGPIVSEGNIRFDLSQAQMAHGPFFRLVGPGFSEANASRSSG